MNARIDHALLKSTILSDTDVGDISAKLEELLKPGGEGPVRRAYVRSSIYPATMGHPGTTEEPGNTEPIPTGDPDTTEPTPTGDPDTTEPTPTGTWGTMAPTPRPG